MIKDNLIESPTISATISVPLSNNKTDLDEIKNKISSSISLHTNVKCDAKYNDNKQLPITTIAGVKNSSSSSSFSVADKDKQQQQQSTTQQNVEFTFSKPNRIDNKRSLFDLDNASSLSLADKLRNEANKYSEASRSNNDVSSVGTHQTNNLGSTTTTTTSTHESNENERKYGSTPSSPMHHTSTAERRPSWRLKIDAGSKVRTTIKIIMQNLQKKKVYKYVHLLYLCNVYVYT